MNCGLRLKELMDKKGIRQMDVCRGALIDSSHLNKICKGVQDMQIETLKRIMAVVKPTPEELFWVIFGNEHDE